MFGGDVPEGWNVSILVLVERPFGPNGAIGTDNGLQVSILVLVERPFGPSVLRGMRADRDVSILVLVERPFGLASLTTLRPVLTEFQSLFWWRGHLDLISGN